MRTIKFRAWDVARKEMFPDSVNGDLLVKFFREVNERGALATVMQYTGLKDKNGEGTTELYEGDIIGKSSIVGNIYETDPRETDLVIPGLGTKAWEDAYKEAVVRGFDYAE